MTMRNTMKPTIGELPKKAHIGLTFRPASTDSIGTIIGIENQKVRGRVVQHVTYNYEHTPEQTHTRPYDEVRSMAFMA